MTCWVAGPRAQGNIDFAAIEIQTVKLADGLYVLMGGAAQGNIVVSAGRTGCFWSIRCTPRCTRRSWTRWPRSVDQPIRYVVNTHLHGDHTAGNEAMAKLGAVIVSHENMRKRMAAASRPTRPLPRRCRS